MSRSNLGSFNAQLEKTLDYLVTQFPNFGDAKIFREKFGIIKVANPKKILEIFVRFVYPYKQKILDKNEDFFLSDKLRDEVITNKDVQQVGNINYELLLSRAINLKNIWYKMSDTQRNTMWKSFEILITLCEKCVIEIIKLDK